MQSNLFWILWCDNHLLRLYPHTYRDFFADEMQEVFAQALADAAVHGRASILMRCLREARDLPQMLLNEYGYVLRHWFEARLTKSEQRGADQPGIVPVGVGAILHAFFVVTGRHPHMRRLFDLFFALVGILLTAPILLVLPLLIKLDSGGPIFYRQARLGKDDRSYAMLKFRSMHVNHPLQPVASLGKQVDFDPRVTRVGRLTRRYHLDEIPQLFNVLKGEMSIFGPRPQIPGQ